MSGRFGEAPDWRDMVDEFAGWDDCVRTLASRLGITDLDATWQLRWRTHQAKYGWMGWRRCWTEMMALTVPPVQPAGEAKNEQT